MLNFALLRNRTFASGTSPACCRSARRLLFALIIWLQESGCLRGYSFERTPAVVGRTSCCR
jgi:hypothetical protein